MPNKNGGIDAMFLCGKNRKVSPVVGTPVYVTDAAMKGHSFPYKYRGGTIIEDLSFKDMKGKVYRLYKVKHKHGLYVWEDRELVEIGAPFEIIVDESIVPGSEEDH